MGGNFSIVGTLFGQLFQKSNYGQAGFVKHSRHFNPEDLKVDLAGKGAFLISGANSGIGKVAALELAKRNAEVHLLCRNQKRGEEALQEIIEKSGNPNVHLQVVDISIMKDVRRFASEFLTTPTTIRALVHNAGCLATKREQNEEGNEITLATHVLGPFLLTYLLKERLARDKSRIIWTTSAGMYTQKLDLSNLQSNNSNFDGSATYAQMKRAQVILTELWSERLGNSGATVNCWHPGWTKTPGLSTLFEDKPLYKNFESSFRETEAGADTLVWLCAKEQLPETGKLWFDREIHATTVKCSFTDSSPEEKQELWATISKMTGVDEQATISKMTGVDEQATISKMTGVDEQATTSSTAQ